MLLLLAIDYALGELAYQLFDFVVLGWDALAFYFFALIAIEAFICQQMLKLNHMRAKAYATLNIIAMVAHAYGLQVFIMDVDYSDYESALMALLIAKIITVVTPDELTRYLRQVSHSVCNSLGSSASVLFIAHVVREAKA